MAERFIDYYDSMSSPWTYLGHLRFMDLAHCFGLTIRHKPMDLLKVWSVSGGLPLKQRAQQRQAYRHQELRRWSEILKIPCNLEPAFHPVADRRACYLVIAAMRRGLDWSKLSHAILRAVWVEDRNIADHATLIAIANENGMDGKALLAGTEDKTVHAEYQSNTDEAMKIGVFGAPTYVFDGELFWGQDRLQMLEWRLTQKLGAPKTTSGEPAVRKRLSDLGQVIPPPEQLTPEALAAYHKAEIDKWWPLVRAAGIKVE